MTKKKILTILLCLLTIIILASCQSIASNESPKTVTVSGNGEVALAPDMASFSVSFSHVASTSSEAQSFVNNAMNQVYDILLNEYKVNKEDIRTTSMTLSPKYSWKDGVQTKLGEEASQSISVKVYDISAIGSIVDSLSKISGVSVSSVQLGLKDESEAAMHARVKAMEDALAKANDYANAAGMSVGSALTISDNSPSSFVYANYSLARATAASAVESSATYYESDVKVSASVAVTFEIH